MTWTSLGYRVIDQHDGDPAHCVGFTCRMRWNTAHRLQENYTLYGTLRDAITDYRGTCRVADEKYRVVPANPFGELMCNRWAADTGVLTISVYPLFDNNPDHIDLIDRMHAHQDAYWLIRTPVSCGASFLMTEWNYRTVKQDFSA